MWRQGWKPPFFLGRYGKVTTILRGLPRPLLRTPPITREPWLEKLSSYGQKRKSRRRLELWRTTILCLLSARECYLWSKISYFFWIVYSNTVECENENRLRKQCQNRAQRGPLALRGVEDNKNHIKKIGRRWTGRASESVTTCYSRRARMRESNLFSHQWQTSIQQSVKNQQSGANL